jgi:predicted RNA-binding Zn-ribbon protein involved in translation (DUF1610 family)
VGGDAEWCTQCLTRLDRPAPSGSSAPGGATVPRRPSTEQGGRAIRSSEQGVVWACPTCEAENPIETMSCRTCGTPFGKLLAEPEDRPRTDPARATAYSLLFPGLGHMVAGRGAEGAARAVIFGYAAATAIIILVMTRGGPGPFLSLLVASALVAVGLYAVSAMDAARVARGEPPIVSARILLYGGAGLILLTVVVLVVVGVRTGQGAP